MDFEDTNTDIVTVEAEDIEEESPLLVAQRYLNIFRQINIFKASKKAEFDNELLNLPEKIKKLLMDLPGGSILLEHILELEEQNNYDSQITKNLLSHKRKHSSYDSSDDVSSHSLTPVSGELRIGNDFANVLARSLASALGNNALMPIGAPSLPVSTTDENGKQVNTQNNAAATTVNNFHVDYSIFQNLADAINKSNSQTHDDFMRVVDALNQNFNPTIVQTDGIPLSAITSSLTQVLKENSRQQLEEMKVFSKTLTDAILGRNNSSQSEKTEVSSEETIKTDTTFGMRKNQNMRTEAKTSPNPAQNSKTQTISVVNKTINPLTSQSTVQKNTYSIPADTVSQNTFSTPKPKKADPLLQAQNVLARTSLSVKPVSLSPQEPVSAVTPPSAQPAKPTTPQYTEYELDDKLNIHQTNVGEEEWEYVDEYGNPITATGEEEWEYVDEYGNPISGNGEEEWEYVEEVEVHPTPQTYVPQTPNVQPSIAPSAVKTYQEDAPKKAEVKQPAADEPVEIKADLSAKEPVSLDLKEEKKEEEKSKSAGIFSSLFKKKASQEDETSEKPKEAPKPAEEPKKDSADDILAAAFGKKTEEAPKEAPKPAEEPKKDSADDILAAAFGKKAEESPKPAEEPKKDSADNILAAAFGKKTEEAPKEEAKPAEEPKKDSADNILAAAFGKKTEEAPKEAPKPAEEPKKDSADDILAAAFSQKAEEAPKEEPKPRMGGILAEAYQEIEREQKTISSKDLLAQAFKSKPQTAEELLNSAVQPKQEETSKEKNVDDILAASFTSSAEKSKEKTKHGEEFDALLKAFSS